MPESAIFRIFSRHRNALKARRSGWHEENTDALLARGVLLSGEDKSKMSNMAVSHPDLLTLQEITVAVLRGSRCKAGDIGAGPWLDESATANPFATGKAGE